MTRFSKNGGELERGISRGMSLRRVRVSASYIKKRIRCVERVPWFPELAWGGPLSLTYVTGADAKMQERVWCRVRSCEPIYSLSRPFEHAVLE